MAYTDEKVQIFKLVLEEIEHEFQEEVPDNEEVINFLWDIADWIRTNDEGEDFPLEHRVYGWRNIYLGLYEEKFINGNWQIPQN